MIKIIPHWHYNTAHSGICVIRIKISKNQYEVHGTVDSLNVTNKIQRYTIFFITVNALYVSGGFFAHHQELKNCTYSIRYMSNLLAVTASVGEPLRLTHASGNSKQSWHIPDAVCTVFEFLMMGGETAWNM